MYKEKILARNFKSIDEYMGAWAEFQNVFLEENESYIKYEVWANFSQEKIKDG